MIQSSTYALGLLCALSILFYGSAPLIAADPQSPNVLFISIDDLNDWTGCLGGHPQAKTPHLDRLAARGILFRRAYCSAPVCNASRTGVMTGVLPSTSGVYDNTRDWRLSQRLAVAVTLPQYFRQNGYWSAGGGKIYHANQGRALTRGFDHEASWDVRFPSRTQQLPDPEVEVGQNLAGLKGYPYFDFGPIDKTDDETMDGRTVAWAVEQLRQKHEKPFFLAVGIYRPHIPWYVPTKYFDQYDLDSIVLPEIREDDLKDVPPIGRSIATRGGGHRRIAGAGKWKDGVRAYLASINFADAMLGRLIEALDKSEYADDTVICLWSDHGWHLGEKLHWEKSTLWEEATRVPLLVVAPGVGQPGTACDRTVSLVDVYPTLVELCGLAPRDDVEGRSLVPLMRDPAQTWERPALTSIDYMSHAVRSERWRYIRYADGSEELYDHENDEAEWTNLADDPQYASVKQELSGWLPKMNAPPDPSGGKRSQPPRKPAASSTIR